MVKKPTEQEQLKKQLSLFNEIEELAEYSDNRYESIEKMVVKDESSIWLNKASGFFAQIVEAMPISVYIKDVHSNFTYMNAKGREMLKFNSQPIIGIKDAEVLSDKRAVELFTREDDEVKKTKKKKSITEEWINENGELIVNVTTRYPIVNENNDVVGVTSIADDLTWKQKALLGREIVYMITHDWVTDLLKGFDDPISLSTDLKIKERHIVFQFVLEYLNSLYIYYNYDNNNKNIKDKCVTCDLHVAVFEPMREMVKFYSTYDSYRVPPKITQGAEPVTVSCVPILLKIIAYQQIRNHLRWGTERTELNIGFSHNKIDGTYVLAFRSPGMKIEKMKVEKFGQLNYESNENIDGRPHIGLFICEKIASLHNGIFKYEYDQNTGENCFFYILKDFNKIQQ